MERFTLLNDLFYLFMTIYLLLLMLILSNCSDTRDANITLGKNKLRNFQAVHSRASCAKIVLGDAWEKRHRASST